MIVFSYFKRLAHNTALMQKMFARLGIDGWFVQNPHGPEVLRRASFRCGTCTDDAACARWLESHETASHPPEFCRNKNLIERISRELSVTA